MNYYYDIGVYPSSMTNQCFYSSKIIIISNGYDKRTDAKSFLILKLKKNLIVDKRVLPLKEINTKNDLEFTVHSNLAFIADMYNIRIKIKNEQIIELLDKKKDISLNNILIPLAEKDLKQVLRENKIFNRKIRKNETINN